MPTLESYPRPSGVLVPAVLERAGCPIPECAGRPEDRRRAAAEVVAWAKRSMTKLPAALLALELPEPTTLLGAWTLGQRTRGAVERIMSARAGQPLRRVGDYVGAPRMGPNVLVDLLAAREEAAVRASEPSASEPSDPGRVSVESSGRTSRALDVGGRLGEVSAIIRDLLPLRPSELGDALVASGVVQAPPALRDVVRAYKESNVPAPFRLVRRGGATVLVAPEAVGAVEALVSSATQLVFHGGACTLSSLVARLGALAKRPLDADVATRVLTAIPRFQWLDEPSGWFSFRGMSNRLTLAIRKVFAVAGRVRLADLERALAKQVRLLATIPVRAIEVLLRDVVGCDVAGGWVRPRARLASAPLSSGERTLVRLLQEHGGELSMSAVRVHAARSGLTSETLRRLVRTSPLLMQVAGRLRVLGEARLVPTLPRVPARSRPVGIALDAAFA